MDKVRLLSCGLLAAAGLSSRPARLTPVAQTVSLMAFFAVPAINKPTIVPLPVAPPEPSGHGPLYTVTATAYEAVAGQTDDEPFVTADNSRIPANYSSRTRWLALSRDLLRPWGGPFEYGDTVRVRGVSEQLDGVYTVHDTMHRRHRHCLDLLVRPSEHVDLYQHGVKLQQVSL